MTIFQQGSPFGRLKQEVIPISRVRIVHHVDRVSGMNNGWHVEYLPIGKARWSWNWRVYRRERNEQAARLCADMILAERSVTLTSYANTEVEV